MRKLTVLGTGCAMVTKCYNTCFVLTNGDKHLLVDAGGGNQVLSRLEDANIPLTGIHDIFVSHRHNDHTVGMIWMVRAIATLMIKGKYQGELTIWCTREITEVIQTMCRLVLQTKFTDFFGGRIRFTEISHSAKAEIIDWSVTFFDIGSKKDQQFGFRAVADDGYRLVFLGDEPYKEHLAEYAEGADMLLHEAYCLYADKDIYKPYEKSHATALDAGRNAAALRAKTLLMYHTEDAYLDRRCAEFTKEARHEYQGAILVPDDLEVISF